MPFRDGAVLGGFLTLLGYLALLMYTIEEGFNAIKDRRYEYIRKDYYWPDSVVYQHPANLEKYNDSINFMVGVSHQEENFDVFNNSYFDIVAYRFEHNHKLNDGAIAMLTQVKGSKLKRCNREYLLNFIMEDAIDWYPDPLCLENPGDFSLNGNWFKDEFRTLAIAVVECQPTNGKFCNSTEEIKTWFGKNNIYFVNQ